jgi:hypothetical protein
MDRSLGSVRPLIPVLAVALAVGLTVLVALVPALRYGGLISPLGLWVAGIAGLALLVAGAALPSARSGTSSVRRSLSVAGLVAAAAVAATGIGSVAALGPGSGDLTGPTPAPAGPDVPGQGVPAFILIDLQGIVAYGTKTDAATCSADPGGTGLTHYQAVTNGPGDLPLTVQFDVGPDGRIGFLYLELNTPTDSFQFASGKYWEAAPPWIVPQGAPSPLNGSATLAGLVDVVSPPEANPGGPPREVSGTLTWECQA